MIKDPTVSGIRDTAMKATKTMDPIMMTKRVEVVRVVSFRPSR